MRISANQPNPIPGARTAAPPSGEPALSTPPDRVAASTAQSEVARSAARHVSAPLRPGNSVDLLVDGKEAYPRMAELLANARSRVDLEVFGVYPDEGGNRFADQLIETARRGVQVNLLVDKVASLSLHNQDLLKRLMDGGVRVQTFTNGYRAPLLHAFQITDHRKLLVVDGETAVTGGMNLGISYEKYWHDFMVQVKGPTVADMTARFEENWKLSDGAALRPVTPDLTPQGSHTAQFAITTPTRHEIMDSMIAAFDHAERSIRINSPYFVEQRVLDALKRAAQRGVAVTVMVPTVGDSPVIDYMNKMATNELLDAGVKVYAYDTTNPDFPAHDHVTDHFNHGKVATVDGTWTTIGSANADTRSMRSNQESNLVVDSPDFARTVETRIFEHDLATRARPAERTEFSPWSWPKRALMSRLRPFLFAF